MKETVIIFKPKKEDVYDWSGNQLLPESRDFVKVNNVVRLQFMDPKDHWGEVIYVKIISKDKDKLKGKVLDTYRIHELCYEYVKNGEIVSFKTENIIEIPYDANWWGENNNLKHLEKLRTNYRTITGFLNPNEENK